MFNQELRAKFRTRPYAYELKRAKFKVRILEASSRVGGRIITRRDPEFAPGLHAEGGAMRIPANHYLLREIRNAHQKVTKAYDKYTLHSYLTDVAGWSTDALNLYDLGNAHVVFENGFIESWKDAFLSSNTSGADAGMQQLQNGMDQVPKAFISTDRGDLSLAEDISYGARVINITDLNPPKDGSSPQIELESETPTGFKQKVRSDYIVLSVPYTAQRAIAKSKAFSPAIEQAIRDV
uniref:Amine oxidase domain-containing protein n=1 Tax=Bionectria ochroleuca TaxID=29856 RepID=A0A0B7KSB7_BIOOC